MPTLTLTLNGLTRKPGVENPPLQISANQLEVDENVSGAHFRIHLLLVKWCNENFHCGRNAIQLSSKPQMSESRSSTICVWSSSGPITIVVMTLSICGILIFFLLHLKTSVCRASRCTAPQIYWLLLWDNQFVPYILNRVLCNMRNSSFASG